MMLKRDVIGRTIIGIRRERFVDANNQWHDDVTAILLDNGRTLYPISYEMVDVAAAVIEITPKPLTTKGESNQ